MLQRMDVRICLQQLQRDLGLVKAILRQLGEDLDDGSAVTASTVSGGTTNHLFKISYQVAGNGHRDTRSKLLRVFGEGSEKWIDRRKESVAFDVLAAHGLSPRCEAEFCNGRIEEFLEEAEPLVHTDFVDPLKRMQISQLMTATHALRPPIEGDEVLWSGFHNLFKNLNERIADGSLEESVVEARTGMSSAQMHAEAGWLAQHLTSWDLEHLATFDCSAASPTPATTDNGFRFAGCTEAIESAYHQGCSYGLETVFAHNDINPGNLLRVVHNGRIYMIDHEYAGYNHRASDIANHFCEYAGFTGDYGTLYPSQQLQLEFLRCYLKHARPCEDVDDCFLEGFRQVVDAFALSSHLYWAVWSVLQSSASSVDFDFLDYARQRLDGYNLHKRMLGLQ